MRQSTTIAAAADAADPDLNIAVAAVTPELAGQAQALAHHLNLPLVVIIEQHRRLRRSARLEYPGYAAPDCLRLSIVGAGGRQSAVLLSDYSPLRQTLIGPGEPIAAAQPESRIWAGLLLLTDSRLELRQLGPDSPGPIYVELLEGPLGYRRKHGGGRQQALARAVGLKGGHSPTVIDATAGLGRDGFILAELGCRVRLIERSPIIHALLADGLQRAMNDPATAAVIRERIELTPGDALQLLSTLPAPAAEVIYLDPMFPERRKSSLVKKELRLLRRIAGSDPDADQLLLAALSKAERRVVVKRPRPAPPLPGPKPSFSLGGKSNRFDVYLINPQQR